MGLDGNDVGGGATMPAPRVRRGAEGWKDLIAAHRASGQSVLAFCAEHGIARSTFGKWRRTLAATPDKARSTAAEKRFLSVPIRSPATPAGDARAVEVRLGSVQVRLSGSAATEVLDVIIARITESS